jgi:hypothetical protein
MQGSTSELAAMNTILGILVLVGNGQVMGAQVAGAYADMKACHEGVQQYAEAVVDKMGKPPEGLALANLCMQLDDDIKALKLPPAPKKQLPKGSTEL